LQDNGEREEVSLSVENTLWANTVVATGMEFNCNYLLFGGILIYAYLLYTSQLFSVYHNWPLDRLTYMQSKINRY